MPISDDIVIIKGPTDEVERVVNEIKNVVDNAKHIEVMNFINLRLTRYIFSYLTSILNYIRS
jgi:hypothetical protein